MSTGALKLTSGQLTAMRQTQQDHHPDVCKVQRLQRTADGKGGWTTGTPLTVYADAPCTATPGAEMQLGGQAGRGLEIELWVVTFPHDYDVQDDDVLTFSDKQMQVKDAKATKSNKTALRCNAEIIEGVPW